MSIMVRKRAGRREEFVTEKIVVSAMKSGASLSSARRIAKDIEGTLKEDSSSEDIRRMVLDKLDRENHQWASDWQIYDRAVKRRG